MDMSIDAAFNLDLTSDAPYWWTSMLRFHDDGQFSVTVDVGGDLTSRVSDLPEDLRQPELCDHLGTSLFHVGTALMDATVNTVNDRPNFRIEAGVGHDRDLIAMVTFTGETIDLLYGPKAITANYLSLNWIVCQILMLTSRRSHLHVREIMSGTGA